MKSRINANIYGMFCHYYFSRLYISRLLGVLGHETLHYVNDDGTGGISEEDAQEGQEAFSKDPDMSQDELKAELIANGKTPDEAAKIAGEIFEDIRAHTFDTKIWGSLKKQFMIKDFDMDQKYMYYKHGGQEALQTHVVAEYQLGVDQSGRIINNFIKRKNFKKQVTKIEEIIDKYNDPTSENYNPELVAYWQSQLTLLKGFNSKSKINDYYKLMSTGKGQISFMTARSKIKNLALNKNFELALDENGEVKASSVNVFENEKKEIELETATEFKQTEENIGTPIELEKKSYTGGVFHQKITYSENSEIKATQNYKYISSESIEGYENQVKYYKAKVDENEKRAYLESLSPEDLMKELGFYYNPKNENQPIESKNECENQFPINPILAMIVEKFGISLEDFKNLMWSVSINQSKVYGVYSALLAILTRKSEQTSDKKASVSMNTGWVNGTGHNGSFVMFTKRDEKGNILVTNIAQLDIDRAQIYTDENWNFS